MSKSTNSSYAQSLTPGGFLFNEMRIVARLLVDGLSEAEIMSRITTENLFQYPTEKNLSRAVNKCLCLFRLLDSQELEHRIADENSDVTHQMCVYANMKLYKLVWDFMVSVIGDKYRRQDTAFAQSDINEFFTRLREQDDAAASWSDSTVRKYKSIIKRGLIESGYLDGPTSEKLNYILIDSSLERAIRANGDSIALPAFNCIGG